MRKIVKLFGALLMLVILVQIVTSWTDLQFLQNNLIRLHVVGNSNSPEDQSLKLKVKDAVTAYLEPYMEKFSNYEDAREFLLSKLDDIERHANSVLIDAGSNDVATVSLEKEKFDTRDYDTFSLPAGVYQALRIGIGDAAGRNWWCVAFPTLCSGTFSDIAVSAGFDDALTNTLAGDEGYQLRFYLLDYLGCIENFLFQKTKTVK